MSNRSQLPVTIAFLALSSAPCSGQTLAGPQWPEFRGPSGDGASDAVGLPLAWSETEHVRWKTAIHDRGWSTPVVWGGQVWLTTATEDGHEMFALCVDRETGKVLRDLHLFHNDKPEPLGNDVNCYAAPSPAIEDGRVYVHFGSYGTACLDTATGKTLWERRDLPCRHFRGPGSSPIFYKSFLILTMDGFDVQYVCALDRKTGATVWKTDRSYEFGTLDGDFRKAYTTPLVTTAGGAPQLLSPSSHAAYSYDPDTGKELWKVRYGGISNASRALAGHGFAFINTGFSKADLWAVRLDARGDVTDTHIVWKCASGVPLKPTPVLAGELLIMVNDSGVATCLEAKTGKQCWQTRLGGQFTGSPVLAEGRVYAFSQEGKTTVLKAAREHEVLATNQLDDGCMASPAIAGKSLFVRTKSHLYRLEN